MDPEHRLVVAVVPGRRTAENTEALVEQFRRRTGGPLMRLMTSDDYPAYEAVTYLTLYSYNFCWPVRTLATRDERGRRRERSPAMAAGPADHVWSMAEWLSHPAVQRY